MGWLPWNFPTHLTRITFYKTRCESIYMVMWLGGEEDGVGWWWWWWWWWIQNCPDYDTFTQLSFLYHYIPPHDFACYTCPHLIPLLWPKYLCSTPRIWPPFHCYLSLAFSPSPPTPTPLPITLSNHVILNITYHIFGDDSNCIYPMAYIYSPYRDSYPHPRNKYLALVTYVIYSSRSLTPHHSTHRRPQTQNLFPYSNEPNLTNNTRDWIVVRLDPA